MLKLTPSFSKEIINRHILWSSGDETEESIVKVQPINKVEQVNINTDLPKRYTSAFNPTASFL